MTDIQRVTVLGTGVLGSQIMMQAAYHGKAVTGYDISEELLAKLPDRWEWMRGYYKRDLPDFDQKRFEEAIESIATTTDIAAAVADADIVIEAIPENLDLKRKVWSQVGGAAPAKTIFTTNTSSLRPSDFADATGRPEKFLALHFANLVWSSNTGEVMVAEKTDPKYFDTVLEFASEIGLEPIPVRKETPGYILNSLSIPFLGAAARLYVDGVANPADIDKVWRIATGSPSGPFEDYDTVGFNVALNIIRNDKDDERLQKFGDLLEKSIDAGKAGLGDGEGFFTYDSDGNRKQPVEDWKLS
ncbi:MULTISPECIES: 3-hydroxyacyl-CoA dehydrogenase [unclassified Mycobacterium]|uniref:3-hydroxyacyl-CoA dehydrogenase n=1 Tax=unclassified Mycobacterium TaxID=2642494 RepID=UPI0009931E23|nr:MULTISPECIES: 3-hydroxyacyl-CoA dehydrogenase [unclassified Mycobacterium]